MYRVIKIGDREVPMLGVASVDIYYKQIFREDLLRIVSADSDHDNTDRIDAIQRMGFVMAMRAELKDREKMMALNELDYLDWLDGFSRGDLIAASAEILALYMGEKATESTEKNGVAG